MPWHMTDTTKHMMRWVLSSYFTDDGASKAETEQITSPKSMPERSSSVKATYITQPQFKLQWLLTITGLKDCAINKKEHFQIPEFIKCVPLFSVHFRIDWETRKQVKS